MIRRLALATLILLCGGCKKREAAPLNPPGAVDSEGRPIYVGPVKTEQPAQPSAPARTPEPPTVYDFERGAADPGSLSTRPGQPASPKAAQPAQPTQPASTPPAARDLNAELSAKLAPMSSCLDLALAAAEPDGRVTISVAAYLQASGRVSRATVTAKGQPASALACIERQVLALSMASPIANAPVQVNGSTQLQIRSVGADAGSTAAAGANVPTPAATNPDLAKPEPGEVAGPP